MAADAKSINPDRFPIVEAKSAGTVVAVLAASGVPNAKALSPNVLFRQPPASGVQLSLKQRLLLHRVGSGGVAELRLNTEARWSVFVATGADQPVSAGTRLMYENTKVPLFGSAAPASAAAAATEGGAKRKRDVDGSDGEATVPVEQKRELWYSQQRMAAILNSYAHPNMGEAGNKKSIARRTAELAAVFGAGRICRVLFAYDLDCMPGTDSHAIVKASDVYVSPPSDARAGTGFVIRTDSYYEADGDAPRLSIQLIPEAVYNTHAAAAKQPLTTDAWKSPQPQKAAKKPKKSAKKKGSDDDGDDDDGGGSGGDDDDGSGDDDGGDGGGGGGGAKFAAAFRKGDTNTGIGRAVKLYRNPPFDKSSVFATEWERDDDDYGSETDTVYTTANYNGASKRVTVPVTETVLIFAYGGSAVREPKGSATAGVDNSSLAKMRGGAWTVDLDAVRVARTKFFGLREADLTHLLIRDSTWIGAVITPLVVSVVSPNHKAGSAGAAGAAYESEWTNWVNAQMSSDFGISVTALTAAGDAARALIVALAKWNYATADAALVASGRTVFNFPLALIVLIAEYAESFTGVIKIDGD